MKRRIRDFAIALCLAWSGVWVLAEPIEIRILYTADLHGHIRHGSAGQDSGGWLRLATLIKQQRRQAGGDRTVLVDCGDTAQGTLEASLSRGQVAVEMLNLLDYDVWVPGNHEFDYGLAQFRALCAGAGGKVLCGNVRIDLPEGKTPGPDGVAYPAWRLFERAGARLAVIGATAGYLHNWFWGEAYAKLQVETAMAMLERIIPEVHRARPDAIILAAHQGWLYQDGRGVNEIRDIVRRFPEIDLVLGGHTHRDFPGLKIGSKTWYVQTASGACHLGVVRLLVDPDQDSVLDISSELLLADATIALDQTVGSRLALRLAAADDFRRRTVGRLPRPISPDGVPGKSCQTSELICQALAAAVGADVVLHGRLSGAGLPRGIVTEADLFGLVPYENRIGYAFLTPAELRAVIGEQLRQQNSSAYCGVWGIRVLTGPDHAVERLLAADGTALPEAGRLKVAFNSYTMAGGGGRFPVLRQILTRPQAGATDSGIDSRDAVRRFLEARRGFNLEMTAWIRPVD